MKGWAVGAVLFVAGCAVPFRGGPSEEEFAKADFGSPPEKPQEAIRGYMGEMLKDPFSAQYQFGRPEKAWYGQPGGLAVSRDIRYGWVVSAKVNAKNGFGGYTGWQMYYFYFRENRIDAVIGPG